MWFLTKFCLGGGKGAGKWVGKQGKKDMQEKGRSTGEWSWKAYNYGHPECFVSIVG